MKIVIYTCALCLAMMNFSFAQSSSKNTTRTRSAKTGQYVTKSYGKKHPSTTVNERSKPRKSSGTKRKKN